MNAIKTQDLTYVYSKNTPFEKVAIDCVNIEITQGEFVGIIGHTGSGKSTLIQHFNGLVQPTSGKIYICENDIWQDKKKIRDIRFQVGLVFQYPEYQLFEETVYKDIAFGPTNMGLCEAEIDLRVKEAMRFVELGETISNKSPFELSGGQKRRVAIAGIIAMNPKILILDEPTAGLDPKGRDRILGQIREYHQQQKNTVLLVSHSMEDIAQNAQKVLVMNDSRVFLYDTVDAVFSKADELCKLGLSVPQVSKVFTQLSTQFPQLHSNVYTLESAKKELLSLLQKKGDSQC